jgi:hypothetical protein
MSTADARPPSGRCRWALSLALVVLLVAALTHAGPARASEARFVYELCDPSLVTGSGPAFQVVSDQLPQIAPFQTCSETGGSVGLRQTGRSMVGEGRIQVLVPGTPGGFVESEVLTAYAERLGASAEEGFVFESGWPADGVGDSRRSFQVHGEPTSIGSTGDFTIGLGCRLMGRCLGGPEVGARDIAATEVDPDPPTLTAATGPLLAPGTLRGHQELSTEVADVGGGVAKVEVLVNSVPAAEPNSPVCSVAAVATLSYTGVAARSPSPCPSSVKASWNLDTAAPPFTEGSNTIQICASDFATSGEPNRTCSTPQTVNVDNSCTESPVGGGATLSAHFAENKQDNLTVRYGAAVDVAGTLTDEGGNPVDRATVCLKLTTEGTAQSMTPIGTATTDSQGHFVYAVPPGPNRQLLIGYRRDSFELTQSLDYRVHVLPTLKAGPKKLRNGERVHLSGSLPGPSAAHRVVVLQANVPGGKRWITFRKATTGPLGRFKADYHFTSTTRKITYRFRALAPQQAGYPWIQGVSKAVKVTVDR